MAEKEPDELAGTEQPFVSHLVELRDQRSRFIGRDGGRWPTVTLLSLIHI